jgi:hypothetical protein
MGNGCNSYAAAVHSVHDSIVADDEFTYVRILVLGHNAAELGKGFQTIDSEDNTFGKVDGVGGGVFGDVVDDLVEVPTSS